MVDVGCAGILVADTFCGPIQRLPREGELLAVDRLPLKIGGCAINVALGLVKHGFSVDVCGCLGRDDAAKAVLGRLESAGLGCKEIVQVDSHPTSKTVILLVEGEDRRFIHSFGANAAFHVAQIRREWIDGLKVFYLGGLFAMPGIRIDELTALLAYCRKRGIVTVVDVVVPHDYSGMDELAPLLEHIDYFLPNDDEARRLTGCDDLERQIETFQSRGAHTVIITCGPRGSIVAQGSKRWKAAAYPVACIDPSGSGDAFDAGIIAGILRRWEMDRTLRFAAALGASSTLAVGTTDGVFTPEQAEAFLADHPLEITQSQHKG
ncbi:MAG: carbohydrate kinase family protein [Pirellulales bacterium]|nr:carbohydrate kinase family protein [Pirellulales bacterium]